MTSPSTRMPAASSGPLRELGHQVLLARRNASQTQAEVAAAAGVSRAAVGRIETGKPVESWALVMVMGVLNLRLVPAHNEKTPR